MSEQFTAAIEKKELLKFALGEGDYHLADRGGHNTRDTRDTREGHWVLGSWNQEIMELHDADPERCAAGVRSMFSVLVGNSPALAATRIWRLLEHLQQYWAQRHGGWLQFDLGPVATPIAAAVEVERERCRHGESDLPLSTIELVIRKIQQHGGLTELS